MINGYIFPSNKAVDRLFPQEVDKYENFSIIFVFRKTDDEKRLKNLEACLRYYRKNYSLAQIIVAEQFSDIPKINVSQDVEKVSFEDSGLFLKSKLMNLSVIRCKYNKIFFCDADILVDFHILNNCLAYLGSYDFSKPYARKLRDVKINLESDDLFSEKREVTRQRTDSPLGGGAFCFTKEFYLKIGGMDEFFKGYGSEDHAFGLKVVNLGKACYLDGEALHLHHDTAVKTLVNYKEIADTNNDYYHKLSNFDQEGFDNYIRKQRLYFEANYLI